MAAVLLGRTVLLLHHIPLVNPLLGTWLELQSTSSLGEHPMQSGVMVSADRLGQQWQASNVHRSSSYQLQPLLLHLQQAQHSLVFAPQALNPVDAVAVADAEGLDIHVAALMEAEVAAGDVELLGGLECLQDVGVLHDEVWQPPTPFVSSLPPDWGPQQQMAAVDAAWYDLCNLDPQLLGVYSTWSDQQWQQVIQDNLLTGDTFAAVSWQRHASVWKHYFELTGALHNPHCQTVLSWLQDGYRSSFVSPYSVEQQAHPKFAQRLGRLISKLSHTVGPAVVGDYLNRSEPLPIQFENSSSCDQYSAFVAEELTNFTKLGALSLWSLQEHGPPVVHPMSVAIHPVTGKKRLCIDANYTNVFEVYQPVQFELLPDVLPLIQPGDWCFVTDCTKGYFHLALHPMFKRFLAVSFHGQTYVFNVLPFGLSSAVRAYTDCMLALYTPMRVGGMRFSFMIDDRFGLACSKLRCWLEIFILVRIACAVGCHYGLAKCILWPQRNAVYLGMLLVLDRNQCCIPAAKVAKFQAALSEILAVQSVSAKQLARVAGMLVSFSLALPLGMLYTRRLFQALTGKASWSDVLPVGTDLHAHLLWLQTYVPAHNGKRWLCRLPGVVLVSDASVAGAGGLAVAMTGVQAPLETQLPQQLHSASSTCREAAGILSLLQTLVADPAWRLLLQHRAIKVFSDNQGVVSDILHMRGAPPVFEQVQGIYELCAAHDIDLQVEWRPREDSMLQFADLLSKQTDAADWAISAAAFAHVCSALQCAPTVDWFARPWSAKCSVFYSRYMMPGAAGINAFDHAWALPTGQLSYICPPHMLIMRVLQKVIMEKADCILVLPAWYKVWHAMLSVLPIRATIALPGTVIEWGERAPCVGQQCRALMAGLRAYHVQW